MVESTSTNESESWFSRNVYEPAANTLKESANAGINLVNLALSPTGAQLDKFSVNHRTEQSITALAVTGLVSAVPYALAGAGTSRLLRLLPAGERTAGILHSGTTGQLAGAALFDGMRDLRPGETTTGNIAGSLAGMSVLELGNSRVRALSFAASLPMRGLTGVAGGIAQSSFSDLGSGRGINVDRWTDASISGGAMNVLLPTLQHALFRGRGNSSTSTSNGERPAIENSRSNNAVDGMTEQVPAPLNGPTEVVRFAQENTTTPARALKPLPLAEFPAFAALSNNVSHLLHKQNRSFEETGYGLSFPNQEKLRFAQQALANIQKIAEGKLGPEIEAHIAAGRISRRDIERMQYRLADDLREAQRMGPSGSNVQDLAPFGQAYAHSRPGIDWLAKRYQGSLQGQIHRVGGIEPYGLDYLYESARSPETTGDRKLDYERAIRAVERALLDPERRNQALEDLARSRMNVNPFLRKYAGEEMAATRQPGPVNLSTFDSWKDAYRVLSRLEARENRYEAPIHGASALQIGRSLSHIEQIATGNFPPGVREAFAQRPDVLNGMRAKLEADLAEQYIPHRNSMNKQSDEALAGAIKGLTDKYQRSPIVRFLEATDQVPLRLDQLQSRIAWMDTATGGRQLADGYHALYAMERNLLDPARKAETQADLTTDSFNPTDSDLILKYLQIFRRSYSSEAPVTRPGDYSDVVPLRINRAGPAI